MLQKTPEPFTVRKLRGAGRAGGQTVLLMTPECCQICQVWCTPVVPALGTQEDHEFEASMGYDAGPV